MKRERDRAPILSKRITRAPIPQSGMVRGFTLLELLVVIGIIAILSTLAIAAVNTARAKARDVKRMHDIRQIGKALDMYYADYGKYPGSIGPGFSAGYYSFVWDITLKDELKDYIAALPVDPINNGLAPYTGYGYSYFVNSDGSQYDLVTALETDNPLLCKYKNWISYTGGDIGFGGRPGVGNSWCGSNMTAIYGTKIPPRAYADH